MSTAEHTASRWWWSRRRAGRGLARRSQTGTALRWWRAAPRSRRPLAADIGSAAGVALPGAERRHGSAPRWRRIRAHQQRARATDVLIYNGGRRSVRDSHGHHPRGVRGDLALAYVRRLPVGAPGRAGDAGAWQRRDLDHRRHRRRQAGPVVGRIRRGQVRRARAGAGDCRRDLHPQGHPRGLRSTSDGAIDMPVVRQFLPHLKDEDLLKALRHRRGVLVPRASGPRAPGAMS